MLLQLNQHIESEAALPNTDLKVDNGKSSTVKVDENDDHNLQANSSPKPKQKKKTKKNVIQEIQEENEEVIPKGSYSMDFSKFDDPNFDPFKSNKTLSNEDASETSLPQHASYAVDFDDPNFDPFKSKKSVMNSPTRKETGFMKIPSNQNQQVEENTGRVTPVEPTIESEAALPNTDLKVDNGKSSTVKVDENDDHNLQANSSPKPKQKKKTKKNVIQEIQEENEEVIPKGSYSMDFSKFDDPNFDPFKSNKTLSNEDASETSLPQHASYAVDFDDPNFDPFKSKKSVMNSPTEDMTSFMKIPSNQNQQVEENTGRVTPVEPTIESEAALPNTDLKVDNGKSSTVKVDENDDHNLQANSSPKPKQKKKTKKKVVQEIQEENEEVIPKGSYSMDFSKFDDPNFDPFKSNKTLSNEDASETSLPQHASYAVDFDDPNFDPFKSKKSVMNSPTRKETGFMKIPSNQNQQVEENTGRVTPVEPTIESEAALPNTDLKVDNGKSSTVKVDENDDHNLQANSSPKPKQKKKTKKNVIQEIQEENEEVIPKGSYSMDFSKFDDPNFDPFKSNKTLSNEDASETSLPQHASYAVDFDDPNFDPFKSKKSVMNSPTRKETGFMKIPSNQNQQLEDTGRVTPVEPTIESEAALPNTDLKVDNGKSSTVKVDENDDHNLKANSSPKPKQKKKTKKKVIQEIQEENEEVIPKGSYSMDFSKFDDPNFDPFKSNKTLSNEDASETSLPQHASYAVDFDDPNFDPFKSKKSVMNSPTRKETGFMKIPSNQNQQVEENTGRVTPVEPTIESEAALPNTDLKVDNGKSSTVKVDENDDHNLQANSSPKPKQKKKTKKKVVQEIQEENEEVIPKGSYSMDFSKFDDPNFDPFKSNKTLSNEDASETSLPQHASYAVDFDDPNFDPFKSKKSVMNSPTRKETGFMKIPSNQNQQVEDTGRVTPVEPTIESEAALPNTDLKVDNGKSSTVKVDKNDDHNLQANSSPKPKQKKKTKKKVVQEIQEENEEVIPKGSYSMDFSKFDDPNFDPFKSNKTLSNEDASETSLPQHASYAVDFDDPNFDPFKSKKSVMNSPTEDMTSFMKTAFLQIKQPARLKKTLGVLLQLNQQLKVRLRVAQYRFESR